MAALKSGDVHVWHSDMSHKMSLAELKSTEMLLTEHERRQCRRFVSMRKRQEYLFSRLLSRFVLARYMQLPLAEIEYVKNAHGKPCLAPTLSSNVHFNVSHSADIIAVAVALSDVGLDVEKKGSRRNIEAIASRYFSKTLSAEFEKRPIVEKIDFFFCYWTLLEAVTKCVGVGLTYPINQISFEHLAHNAAYKVHLPAHPANLKDALYAKSQVLSEDYQMAVVLHGALPNTLNLHCVTMTQLIGDIENSRSCGH